MPLRILNGIYLACHRDGGGDVQNVSDDDSELLDEEVEDSPDGRENIGAKVVEGVASSLGDLSVKGSLAGVAYLNTRRSKRLILNSQESANSHEMLIGVVVLVPHVALRILPQV